MNEFMYILHTTHPAQFLTLKPTLGQDSIFNLIPPNPNLYHNPNPLDHYFIIIFYLPRYFEHLVSDCVVHLAFISIKPRMQSFQIFSHNSK